MNKLTIPEGVASEVLGGAVAIEGDRVVVGASSIDGGAVYVFDTTTGQPVHKLVSDDLTPGDAFGTSVSLSGNRVLVGASHKDYTTVEDGTAYLFDLTTGSQIARIDRGESALDASEFFVFHFGHSVAISGDTALIGTTGFEPNRSSAYLYQLNTTDPPLDLLSGIAQGVVPIQSVVALDGNTAIIGTPNWTGNVIGPGAAFIYDATTGVRTADLLADDGRNEDKFGQSVAISGNLALVGAPRDTISGDQKTGSAYLFDITTGNQLFKLTADDASDGDRFGSSVAIHEHFAIVGSPGTDGGGAVYLFDLLTGQQVTKFSGSDTVTGNNFGVSMSVDGDALIVGAPRVDGAGLNSGAAYLFTIPEPGALAALLALGPVLLRRKDTQRSAILR